jgi:hypothetical protein
LGNKLVKRSKSLVADGIMKTVHGMMQTQTLYTTDAVPHEERLRSEKRKIEKLVADSHKIIYELSSVFPFQLFPDHIIIDTNKVSVVRKQFLYKRAFPILLEDILTIKVSRSLFFASIEFEIRGFEQNPSILTYLWPSQASLAKQYIVGLMKARKDNIDLSLFTIDQLRSEMRKIGRSADEISSVF